MKLAKYITYYFLARLFYYILKDFPNLRKNLDLDNILVHDLLLHITTSVHAVYTVIAIL